jgi:hypothetical protein
VPLMGSLSCAARRRGQRRAALHLTIAAVISCGPSQALSQSLPPSPLKVVACATACACAPAAQQRRTWTRARRGWVAGFATTAVAATVLLWPRRIDREVGFGLKALLYAGPSFAAGSVAGTLAYFIGPGDYKPAVIPPTPCDSLRSPSRDTISTSFFAKDLPLFSPLGIRHSIKAGRVFAEH